MRIEGTVDFKAPREQVFSVFTDPQALSRATPGVQEFVPAGDGLFRVSLKLGVAGISGSYTGTLELRDVQAPERYQLAVLGQGTPGRVKGTGGFTFTEIPDGTQVAYVWDVEIHGLLASVGQRVIGGVAKMLLSQFAAAMNKELQAQGRA